MKDFYTNVRECIDDYNRILDKICTSPHETTDAEDERLQNHTLYLAHALIKDINVTDVTTVAKIILDTVK